jgi:hypothetical protein
MGVTRRFNFLKSEIVLVSLVWLIHIVTNVYIIIHYMKKSIMFHHVTVKWCIQLFKSGPGIFQCFPVVISHLYRSQKYIHLLEDFEEEVLKRLPKSLSAG